MERGAGKKDSHLPTPGSWRWGYKQNQGCWATGRGTLRWSRRWGDQVPKRVVGSPGIGMGVECLSDWGCPYATEEAGSARQPTLLYSATPPARAVSPFLHSRNACEKAPSILLVLQSVEGCRGVWAPPLSPRVSIAKVFI